MKKESSGGCFHELFALAAGASTGAGAGAGTGAAAGACAGAADRAALENQILRWEARVQGSGSQILLGLENVILIYRSRKTIALAANTRSRVGGLGSRVIQRLGGNQTVVLV